MVVTLDEIKEKIKKVIGDNTDDDTLSLLEDVEDTYTSLKTGDGEDWKKRYEDNDKEWRKRYRERFYGNKIDEADIEDEGITENEEKTKFEELFEEV